MEAKFRSGHKVLGPGTGNEDRSGDLPNRHLPLTWLLNFQSCGRQGGKSTDRPTAVALATECRIHSDHCQMMMKLKPKIKEFLSRIKIIKSNPPSTIHHHNPNLSVRDVLLLHSKKKTQVRFSTSTSHVT